VKPQSTGGLVDVKQRFVLGQDSASEATRRSSFRRSERRLCRGRDVGRTAILSKSTRLASSITGLCGLDLASRLPPLLNWGALPTRNKRTARPKLGKMKISPLRRQKATSMKILQGLLVHDGIEHVVTVGFGPGVQTAPEREGPKPRAERIIVASRDGGVELSRRTVWPPLDGALGASSPPRAGRNSEERRAMLRGRPTSMLELDGGHDGGWNEEASFGSVDRRGQEDVVRPQIRRGREEAPQEAAQGAREVQREERQGGPYGLQGQVREEEGVQPRRGRGGAGQERQARSNKGAR
ncbi:hypothetical protein THAOC_30687, partial [Thalassiosira oceanica]